jgi:hypothetical protein
LGTREIQGEARKVDHVRLRECEAETEVTPEDLKRTLELLAKCALRRGQKVLEDAGIDLRNRVTGYGIKGYGANQESN